jgi:hypothetical protein
MFTTRTALAVACAMAACAPATAADSDLTQLREEMKALQRSYDDRMRALEKRLEEAEARAAKAEGAASQQVGAAAAAPASASPAARSESAFNPAISLILQGTYARTSEDPNNFQISGFVPSGGEVGPPKRGFRLGESELNITANIDPYFRGVAIVALTPENEVEVEEAYFQTLALGRGFTLKGGRFLSGIGYQNEIHQHAWDFQDAPLPYNAFLAGRYSQDGVQLRWVAPTALFAELGVEAGNGQFFPGNDRNKNGVNSWALFGHLGGDIGTSYAWRAGVSYLRTSASDRSFEDIDSLGAAVTNSFTGTTRMWIADAVLKWAPNGDARRTHVKLQAEYFRPKQTGTLAYDDTAQPAPQFGSVFSDRFRAAQSGWYAQAVWQFMPRWRLGYRYDELRYGDVNIGIVESGAGPTAADFSLLAPHSPTRNTLMVDFSPSEFSRLRLQLASDASRRGATDKQVILQYIHSLGPHGAHRF